MSRTFNVLISSCGRRVELMNIFRRALEDLGRNGNVFGSDMSRLSAAFHYADKSFTVPPVKDDQFIPRMLEICTANDIKLVVPTIDPELPVYAAVKDKFAAAGITVGIGSPETIAIGSDKVKTSNWLTDNKFPTVRQAPAAEVAANPDGWKFPLLIKPQFGSASIGVQHIETPEHIKLLAGDDYLVQTIAPGAEYTVDVFVDEKGRCNCAVPRKRLEVRAGEVSKAVTERSTVVSRTARAIARALPGAYGVMCIQIFYDKKSGALNVIEINPRFGGGFPLTDKAGADMAGWLIEMVAGGKPAIDDNCWSEGKVMLRYDAAVFTDAKSAGI